MQSDPIRRHDTTLNGNGHVDQMARVVGESVQFRGRLVTQGRTRTGRENGRPQMRGAAGYSGKGGVDTTMQLLPLATDQPELDHVRGETCPDGL
jgi:hypothetical protein